MNTYNLKTVEEKIVTEFGITTTFYEVPVDESGVSPTDYLSKDRIKKNNQLLVFDTKQEYLDYLSNNP